MQLKSVVRQVSVRKEPGLTPLEGRPVTFQVPLESLRTITLNTDLELGEGEGHIPITPGEGWDLRRCTQPLTTLQE